MSIKSRGFQRSSGHRRQGARIYYGFGLLLLALSPFCYCANLPLGLNGSISVSAVCLAGVSCAFALLEDGLAVSGRAKALLPWLYGAGTILTLSSWPWLQGLLDAWPGMRNGGAH
jgi:hypothetical protein